MWLVAAVAGAVAVVSTALPFHVAVQTTQRVAPVLVFLAAVTVLAGLADAAGLFEVAGRSVARRSGGTRSGLLLMVCALATLVTVLLSLDTTAVLLTPVALALAAATDTDPRPFAFAVVWLANAASLLLPISNLTNLLALGQFHGVSTFGFAQRMALPELAAVTVVVAVLLIRFRSQLRGRHAPPGRYPVADRPLLWLAGGCALVVGPAALTGLAPWKAALPAAVVLVVASGLRQRRWGLALLPWRLLLLTEGLFLVVAALGRHGLNGLVSHLHGPVALELAGAGGANVVNNLPAYLAVEPAAAGNTRDLLALLIGTNAGPLLLLTGSLATLLWREQCRTRGLQIGVLEFLGLGLLLVPLLLAACYGALLLGS